MTPPKDKEMIDCGHDPIKMCDPCCTCSRLEVASLRQQVEALQMRVRAYREVGIRFTRFGYGYELDDTTEDIAKTIDEEVLKLLGPSAQEQGEK